MSGTMRLGPASLYEPADKTPTVHEPRVPAPSRREVRGQERHHGKEPVTGEEVEVHEPGGHERELLRQRSFVDGEAAAELFQGAGVRLDDDGERAAQRARGLRSRSRHVDGVPVNGAHWASGGTGNCALEGAATGGAATGVPVRRSPRLLRLEAVPPTRPGLRPDAGRGGSKEC